MSNADTLSAARRPTGRFWPVFLTAMLGSLIAGLGYMVYRAVGDVSFGVERDYYQKSLRWDAHMAQQAHNAALGWRLTFDVPRADASPRTLSVLVTDREGKPLEDGRVTAEAFHLARSADVRRLTFSASAAGRHAAAARFEKVGLWELRFVVLARGERFTVRRRVDVAGSP